MCRTKRHVVILGDGVCGESWHDHGWDKDGESLMDMFQNCDRWHGILPVFFFKKVGIMVVYQWWVINIMTGIVWSTWVNKGNLFGHCQAGVEEGTCRTEGCAVSSPGWSLSSKSVTHIQTVSVSKVNVASLKCTLKCMMNGMTSCLLFEMSVVAYCWFSTTPIMTEDMSPLYIKHFEDGF